MKKAICLDFDGVIVDSIKECFIISSTAASDFHDADSGNPEYETIFYKYRYLVRPPHQYLYLNRAVGECVDGKLEEAQLVNRFYELDAEGSPEEIEAFEAAFFGSRERYREDMDAWLALHELTEYGKTLPGKKLPDYFIITNKDGKSVEILLRHYDIDIREIYSKEAYVKFGTKSAVISDLLDREGYESADFVDDAVEHLDSVTDERINCYFADWAYDRKKNKYPVYDYL